MSSEAFFLTQAVNCIILCRLMYQWLLGQFDQKAMIEGVKMLLCLVGATLLAEYASQFFGSTLKIDTGLNCIVVTQGLYECNGWPIISEFVGKPLGNLLKFLGAGLGVPAGAAALIAQTYLFRRLSSNLNFSAEDLFQVFFWSSLVFFIIYRLDLFLSWMTNLTERVGFLSIRVAEGQKNLKSWLDIAMPYFDLALENGSWFSPKFLFIGLGISLVAIVLNIGSFTIIMFQVVLLAFIPLSFFKDALSENKNFSAALARLLTITILGSFKSLNWAVISFFYRMPEPTYIDGKIIVTAKDASRIFGLSLLMVVGVLGSYFFAIWACRKVYERVFS